MSTEDPMVKDCGVYCHNSSVGVLTPFIQQPAFPAKQTRIHLIATVIFLYADHTPGLT